MQRDPEETYDPFGHHAKASAPIQQQQQQQQQYERPQTTKAPASRPTPTSSGPAAFNKRPTAASNAVVPAKGGRQVSIVSNQYSIKLGGRMVVYQYKIEVRELDIWDANLVQQIVKQKRRALDRILGQYVTSGAQLYTITELDESIEMAVPLNGTKYSLVIDKSTQATVTLDDEF